MTKELYSEVSMAIDLVIDAYKLKDPFEIQSKIEQTLGMEVHINQILDYINWEEDYEKASYFVSQDYQMA